LDEKCISNTNIINTLSTFDWAIKNNKEYDIFLFLGTNTMNLLKIKKAIEEYKSFLKKSVKYVLFYFNIKRILIINYKFKIIYNTTIISSNNTISLLIVLILHLRRLIANVLKEYNIGNTI